MISHSSKVLLSSAWGQKQKKGFSLNGETFGREKGDSIWKGIPREFSLSSFSQATKILKPLPSVITETHFPNKSDWKNLIEKTIEEIKKGSFRKVVLARVTTLNLSHAPDRETLLNAICYRGGLPFLIEWDEESAFLGCTPEILFRRDGLNLQIDALAGTRPIGKKFEKELLESEKDLREVAIVKESIYNLLPSFSTSITSTPYTVKKAANVQHLHSTLSAQLMDHVTDEMLIKALHPTPAVGGFPTEPALRWIEEYEPFDRGYFAGPLTLSSPLSTTCAVAIRSALIKGSAIHLFAGVGIVEGSNWEQEWNELDTKIALFRKHLF